MKIAIFCPDYPPAARAGGISHYTQQLARHLAALGEEILIVAGAAYRGEGADGPITVLKFAGAWHRQTMQQMINALQSRAVDIVNLQYSPAMYQSTFKFLWPHVASHFTCTISFHTLWGGERLNYLLALRLLTSADGIIATNSEIMYLLKKYLPCCLKKTYFVPIGANIEPSYVQEDIRNITKKYSLEAGTNILVYFGMIYQGKGIDMLLETMCLLSQQSQSSFKLLIIGGGIADVPAYLEDKRRLCTRLGLDGNVMWLGRLPAADVSALLRLSAMVLLPFEDGVSDRRGSLMAALAHGKAVVTTPPGVPIKYFVNGHNMLWPATIDPQRLAEATLSVHNSAALRHTLEDGALQLASHFSWSRIAEDTRQILRAVYRARRSQKTP